MVFTITPPNPTDPSKGYLTPPNPTPGGVGGTTDQTTVGVGGSVRSGSRRSSRSSRSSKSQVTSATQPNQPQGVQTSSLPQQFQYSQFTVVPNEGFKSVSQLMNELNVRAASGTITQEQYNQRFNQIKGYASSGPTQQQVLTGQKTGLGYYNYQPTQRQTTPTDQRTSFTPSQPVREKKEYNANKISSTKPTGEKIEEETKLLQPRKYVTEVVTGGIEYTQDFIEQMRTEAKQSLPKKYQEDKLAVAVKSVPITIGTLAIAPLVTIGEIASGGILKVPEKTFSLIDTPKKIGGLIISSIAFKGAAKIPNPIKSIPTIGIPKVELTKIKSSTEAFPTIRGGVKELEAKLYSGKTQTFLKQEFSEVFQKKAPIAIRTTTKETVLKDVKRLGQYEEVAPFYGTEPSMIGLPQFKGFQDRAIVKWSLFKSGTEKGAIEVLQPKGFSLLPKLKAGVIPSFKTYKSVSEFVGINLEKVGAAKKSLPRIRVKVGENILSREYSKVASGRRPFKLREIDTLTGGRIETMKAFVEPKGKAGIAYPTRAFQLGATTESEVIILPKTGVALERMGVKGLRQKYFGSPSLVVTEGLESAGVKFYKPISISELDKKPLLDKVASKLESFRLKETASKMARFSRGEVFEYRPLVTAPRTGLFSVVKRPVERVVDRVTGRTGSVSSRVSGREVSVRKPVEDYRVPVERQRVDVRRVSVSSRVEPIRVVIDERPREITRVPVVRRTPIIVRTPVVTRVPTITRVPNVPPTIIPIPIEDKRILVDKKKFGLRKGFSVFSRVKGKKIKIGDKLPFNLATGIGKKFTAETTARSFVVVPEGFTNIQDVGGINLGQYRTPKFGRQVEREGFKFVEKSQFAIDTIGEKKGLLAGRRLRVKTKLFK
jgi:hypothetical protein